MARGRAGGKEGGNHSISTPPAIARRFARGLCGACSGQPETPHRRGFDGREQGMSFVAHTVGPSRLSSPRLSHASKALPRHDGVLVIREAERRKSKYSKDAKRLARTPRALNSRPPAPCASARHRPVRELDLARRQHPRRQRGRVQLERRSRVRVHGVEIGSVPGGPDDHAPPRGLEQQRRRTRARLDGTLHRIAESSPHSVHRTLPVAGVRGDVRLGRSLRRTVAIRPGTIASTTTDRLVRSERRAAERSAWARSRMPGDASRAVS